MNMKAAIIITKEVPCLLCGKAIMQADVDAGLVIGLGHDLATLRLFCISHFYIRHEGRWVTAPGFDINMDRISGLLAEELASLAITELM